MSNEIHSVGPFILGKSLGSGATGKVKLGFHKETGFKVAVKIINKEFLASRPSMRKKVEREIVVMKLIDHPNVLRLYDVYETSKYLFLVLEYVEGGELFDYLVTKGSLEPAEALNFFQQIIIGLEHCHNHIICHRDLKPENILLLEGEKRIKIADFGMASLMRRNTLLSTSCGSPHYASPEVVTGSKYNGMLADIWSCGVILFALLSGKLPFDDDNIRKLLAKVKSGAYSMPAYLPRDAQDLITKMLTVDPSKRIIMEDIKKHPWFLSNSPLPYILESPTPIELLTEDPLEDLSMIDDEIMRSLKALGLGSELDIQLALTSKKSSIIIVLYRLLEKRKENQSNDSNNIYPTFNRPRNRSHTINDRDRLTMSGGVMLEGKTRANSLFSPNNDNSPQVDANTRRTSRRSFSSHTPSPLANTRGHTVGSEGFLAISSSSTPPDGASPITTSTSVSGTSSSSHSQEQLYNGFNPLSPPTSPKQHHQRRHGPPSHRSFEQPTHHSEGLNPRSPTQSPPQTPNSSTTPINIYDKFRRMKLATENITPSSPPPGSPIIGSNPKRSWFSNFFTGSPQSSPRDQPPLFSMATLLDGEELTSEVQRSLSALNTNWHLDSDNLYEANYKSGDGTEVEFSVEIMDGKSKQNTDIRVVALTLQKGPTHYFNFLCSQFRNEARLE